MNTQITPKLVSPYRKPESDLPGHSIFNNHLSHLRIRSEHAIGCLKGRFQSLKELRKLIDSEKAHHEVTYWLSACICVHNLALCEEAYEKDSAEDADIWKEFIWEGLQVEGEMDRSHSDVQSPVPADALDRHVLANGKKFRDELKAALLESLGEQDV